MKRQSETASSTPSIFRRTALAAALSGLFALPAAPALAGTITVVSGGCTLIDAIKAANEESDGDGNFGSCTGGTLGADTIVLPTNSTQTLTEINGESDGSTGLPSITSAITIQGNGSTVARQAGSVDFRIFHVDATGDLTLQQTTVAGGLATYGGAIYNRGALTLTNCTLSGNSAFDEGGGLFQQGDYLNQAATRATLVNSTVSGNSSNGDGGGGISSQYAQLTLTRSTVSGNSTPGRGGGVAVVEGSLSLRNSTISGNLMASVGGGIDAQRSTLDIHDSTISGNTSSAAGGGMYLFRNTVVIERSLVSGNVANVPAADEIFNDDNALTLSRNLFGHSGQTSYQAFYGFTPGVTDINATSDGTTGILDPTALADIRGPLADNGGPTLTHALVAGSPALDAVPTSDTGCTGTDQRGTARPQGTACDIGSFELGAAPAVRSLSISDTSRVEGKSGPQSMQFIVRLSSAATSPVTVGFTTANGSAMAGSDYTARSGTVTFMPGKTAIAIEVKIKGDRILEPDETVLVNLFSPSSGTTIADSQGVGTIVNDD